ncbi:MAG: hypothetical protein AABZ74_16735 [Cyanobacteriota bacterium]
MSDCEKLPKCPFFDGRMSEMPNIGNMLKKKYCQGDNTDCARYLVSGKFGKSPLSLYPNMKDRAIELLKLDSIDGIK